MGKGHRYCKFIPDNVLEKIPDQDKADIGLDTFYREQRAFFLANPDAKRKIHKTTHKEIRNLFDSGNKYVYTNKPIATDEQIHSSMPSKYPALELANIAYDFFHNRFDLESFDGKNAPIDVHINYGSKYNNAFWDGFRMVFGNGDGKYFNSFLIQNVFTHEFVHAITEHKCGLLYKKQHGALNESYSDVFAAALDQRLKKQKPTEASWLIGEGVFNTNVIKGGKALRSFKPELAYNDPIIGKDPQPWHMKDYKDLPDTEDGDWGGVHINSKIPNRAFYEFCILAQTEVGDERMNYAWKAPAEIWFNTYKRTKPTTVFREFALDTISVTKLIHPQLQKQIKKAWQLVGVLN